MHNNLVEKISNIREISNESPLNKVIDNGADVGVIASGGAYNYVADVINQNNLKINILKIGFSHPYPEKLVKTFLENNKEVLVVEEVDPINEIETLAVAGRYNINTKIHGKKDEHSDGTKAFYEVFIRDSSEKEKENLEEVFLRTIQSL